MRLICAMQAAIERYLRRFRPDFVMSIAIDCYVTDLLERCARRRGIPFFGIAIPTVDTYMLVTRRGERNPLRRPTDAEIDAVIRTLRDRNFAPSYMTRFPGDTAAMLRRWRRELVKFPYFAVKRLVSRDPLNYHYWSSCQLASERARPSHLFSARYVDRTWEQRVGEFGGKIKILYMPLRTASGAQLRILVPASGFHAL